MRVAAVLISLMALSPAAGQAPKGPPELKGLAGEWRLLSTEDEKRPDAGDKALRMVVGPGGQARFRFGAVETNTGTFAPAKAAGKLKAIDLKLADGQVYRGVYAIDGDRLVICFGEAGEARPAGLRPKGGQWVERWKRVGKGARPKPAR